ncbi:MAG: hypothetical protein LBI85_05155 [Spirochaetaceae bacterium]|jgi:hypothetical protein|nr:hypothetical protein [Spirochaetaceae bacterium]
MKVEKKKKIQDMDGCLEILNEEIAILEELVLSQDLVRQAVIAREWADFEGKIDELNRRSFRFEELESERSRLFTRFLPEGGEKDEDLGFYSLISRLPLEQRSIFADRFRQVKLLILRIRLANESLLRYIEEARATVTDFLDAAFPDRRGRFYTRRGKAVASDMRSMVLDRSL